MERSFNAGTIYNDFLGTAAADGYMHLQSDLEKLGVPISANESLAGIRLSLAEIMRPHRSNPQIKPYVTAYFESRETPGVYRPIRLGFTTLEDFVRIFKRFEVSLSLGGGMTDKTFPEYDSDRHSCHDIDPAELDELE